MAQIIEALNYIIGIITLITLCSVIVVFNFRTAKKELNRLGKDSQSGAIGTKSIWSTPIVRAIYLWFSLVIPQAFAIGFLWGFTSFLANILKPEITIWVIITFVAIPGTYAYTRGYGEGRGLVSAIGHLVILLIGWFLGKWLGLLFISTPFIALYYYMLYHLAEVTIPASDPDNRSEKFERFRIFVCYMWGVQYPVIIVPDRANAKAETIIHGSVFRKIGAPGLIWTNAYQVVGLTVGTNFSRVEGPGAIYTRRFERVKDVIDLRTHLLTKVISAITQNGIGVQATLFASFCIKRLPVDNSLPSRLRHAGSYPYSRPCVQAALKLEGVDAAPPDSGNPALRWDDQVMSQIEETARRVIGETSLEELWYPGMQDANGISSLDLIAVKIRGRLENFLKENGIQLFSARIVNYALAGKDEPGKLDAISTDRLPLWKARLEKALNKKLVEAAAEAEQKKLNAAVVGSTKVLKSIAESLKSTTTMKGSFSRNLIAMRFLNIIYDMIQEESSLAGDKGQKLMKKISTFRGY